MGFTSFLIVTINIWVVVLAISFVRVLLRLAPKVEIGIRALGNDALTEAWDYVVQAGQIYVLITFVVFVVLWILYRILMEIFPIDLIIEDMSPFRELRERGLFGLFDALFQVVVSRDGPLQRINRVVRAMMRFLLANFSPRKTQHTIVVKPIKSNTSKEEDEEKKNDTDPPFSESDIQRANEEFQQCVEEKSTLITPDMSSLQVSTTNAQNVVVEMQCKMQAVQTALNNFAYSR